MEHMETTPTHPYYPLPTPIPNPVLLLPTLLLTTPFPPLPLDPSQYVQYIAHTLSLWLVMYKIILLISQALVVLLVSAGHLCDLQGQFSEIDNLCRVNRNELQLSS